jgi:hypothetical protein
MIFRFEFHGQVIRILIDSSGYTDEPLVTRPADFYEDDIRKTQLLRGNHMNLGVPSAAEFTDSPWPAFLMRRRHRDEP